MVVLMSYGVESVNGVKGGRKFTILVVDDDLANEILLQELMKEIRGPHELHFVRDGLEALEFLGHTGGFADAPRPDLILLDINLPRLGGLETLSAIKSDPELYMIPVIMLTSSDSPQDVRESYEANANGYVKKPFDLDGSMKVMQAIGSFWMDCAILPRSEQGKPIGMAPLVLNRRSAPIETPAYNYRSGPPIAIVTAEANGTVIHAAAVKFTATAIRQTGCDEHSRLLDEFGGAVGELLALHEEQFRAIAEDGSEFPRFDLLIHMANEKKQKAKYSFLRHLEAHGCSKINANQT
jgi:chemotaxis family two-component system response regulator Rcp1